MYDSYHLQIQDAYPEAALVERAPFIPSYALAYARPDAIWHVRHPDFLLTHQAHDARHAYVSLLEIEATKTIRIPVNSCHSDLHMLYVLTGGFTFHTMDSDQGSPMTLLAKQYGQVYYPAGQQGTLTVPMGRHLLVGLAVESGWQTRYDAPSIAEQQELLERLRTKNHRCRISKAYQMDDQIRITVVGLLDLPFMEGMKLDHAIDGYVVQLHELHGRVHRTPLAQPSDSLIAAIKQGIRQQIESQQFPSVAKLATDLGKPRQTLYRHFSKEERQSIKAYMTQTVMEEALWRLREQRLSPAAVAYGLGYAEQSSFNHQFKSYYGMTPTEAQEAVEVPKPRKGKKFV